LAISTPTEANDNPITIITGPTTIAGKILSIKPSPHILIIPDIIPYTTPTAIIPDSVPARPNISVDFIIGAINAKLDPKKTGTLPLVIKWNIRVPTPAEKRAIDGSIPTSRGTSTVAPKATNRN
jgi:hypothetical protein